MRRATSRVIGGAVLAGLIMLVSACSSQLPRGTDGDLTDEWPAIAAATGWTPKQGDCHMAFKPTVARVTYAPMACTDPHYYETVFLGEVTGTAATATASPAEGGADMNALWASCDKKTAEFLGADWRLGKVWFGVSLPSSAGWTGGARWYKCEVAALDDTEGDPVSWDKSLKGEFSKASALKFGCYSYGSDLVDTACNKSHNAEFVGIYTANVAYSKLHGMDDKFASECRKIVARYVGVPNDSNMKYRTGTIWHWPSQREWESGDHGVRCHLWLGKKKTTKSLKGAGTKGLPINYA